MNGDHQSGERGEDMEDREIVELYWKRDEAAIRETAQKYGGYCYAIAYNILRNAEDAKEGVNDAYMNAWNSMPPHRPEALSAFMGKVTRFVCLKRWRAFRAQKRGGGESALVYEELSDCIPDATEIDSAMQAREIAKVIDHFLETLPAVQRRVFVCRYWYFDSVASIGERFGFSESKVKSMLFRLRMKLMNRLKKEGILIEN